MRHLRFVLLSVAVAASSGVVTLAQSRDLPDRWFKGGRPAENYDTGIDTQTRRDGAVSVFVRARSAAPGGFGTIMRVEHAERFRGKRVRMAGYVKANDVREWAGLWMRVDGADPTRGGLTFDNMARRPIRGTQNWTRHEVVLDVPAEAELIHYGLLLGGEGTVWATDLALEIVGLDVPTTELYRRFERTDPGVIR